MSDGQILHGVQFDPKDGITKQFTQQMMDYTGPSNARVTGAENEEGVEIVPRDKGAALVTRWQLAAIQAQLDTIFLSWDSYDNIQLPTVLTDVQTEFSKTSGDGTTSYPASQAAFLIVNSGGSSLSPRAEAQSSASIIPVVQPILDEPYGVGKKVTYCVFYVEENSQLSDILTKLSAGLPGTPAVNEWPNFQPTAITITAIGQQISIHQTASSQASLSFTEDVASKVESFQWGNGFSTETGQNIQVIRIPPTLHGALEITDSDSSTATTTIEASTVDLEIDGTPEVAAIVNAPTPISGQANGTITSTVFATDPADIPRTGIYLYLVRGEPHEYNRTAIFAGVIDMTQFA